MRSCSKICWKWRTWNKDWRDEEGEMWEMKVKKKGHLRNQNDRRRRISKKFCAPCWRSDLRDYQEISKMKTEMMRTCSKWDWRKECRIWRSRSKDWKDEEEECGWRRYKRPEELTRSLEKIQIPSPGLSEKRYKKYQEIGEGRNFAWPKFLTERTAGCATRPRAETPPERSATTCNLNPTP